MGGAADEWKMATLEAHNRRRVMHGCPPVEWSDECYQEAKKQADACEAQGVLQHGHLDGPSGRQGQNAYWTSGRCRSADAAVGPWYDEIKDYDFATPGFKAGTGHFTQVVWKGTTHVGMAASRDGRFVVANYWPAGNVQRRFELNVPPLGADATPLPESGGESPAAGGSRRKGGAAGRSRSVKASADTPELMELLDGCPFDFENKVRKAFEGGAAEVTVTRTATGEEETLEVVIKKGRYKSTMSGSWS